MKIFFNPIAHSLKDNAQSKQNITEKTDNTVNTTSLSNFPNYSYQINFGANSDNLESFYTAYSDGKGMPASYNMHLNTYTAEERAKIKEVFANYRSFYDNMENCHTVEELQQAYPLEFKNLQSSFSQEARDNSFLNKFQDLTTSIMELGEYVFLETQDNDLTVYLAKKIYLESKTKDEIDKDFYNDLNKFYDIEDYKARFPFGKDGIIPQNIYKNLGLTTSRNETGFRLSLCCSRDDYIRKYGSVYKSKRKENFDEFIEDVLS
ncbi:MAG: hypothetical protein MJ180_00695, partial [Candidatus Gastranaerophilales bacterium]|nr:hypothetical protein [Candidatus Gastranaerophilales bacterium]